MFHVMAFFFIIFCLPPMPHCRYGRYADAEALALLYYVIFTLYGYALPACDYLPRR